MSKTNKSDEVAELAFQDALSDFWEESETVNSMSRMLGQIQHPEVRGYLAELIGARVSDRGLCRFVRQLSLIRLGESNALVKLVDAGVNVANASALRQQLDSTKAGGFKLPPSGKSKPTVTKLDI